MFWIEHGHLSPLVPRLASTKQPLADGMRLRLETHTPPNHRLNPLPAAGFGYQHRVFIVCRHAGSAHEFFGDSSSQPQYLHGISVVDLEDARSSFGFDAELTPHRPPH